MKLKDDIRVAEGASISMGALFKDDLRMESNVRLRLIDKAGRIVEERHSHNIFLNYGREWLAELVALNTGYTTFRNDRIRYMAVGIGGTSQLIESDTIRNYAHGDWTGYPDDWVGGGPTSSDPDQEDTDPTLTGLEWPVPTAYNDYYEDVYAPATFPAVGQVRFTSVYGYTDINFGAYTSVPLSEIGLFTEGGVGGITQSIAPLPAAEGPSPGERFMVAYNTFDTISKTPAFVLQVDWELRFS